MRVAALVLVVLVLVVPPLVVREPRSLTGAELVAAVTTRVTSLDKVDALFLRSLGERAGFRWSNEEKAGLDGRSRTRAGIDKDDDDFRSWTCWRCPEGLIVAETTFVIRAEHRVRLLDRNGERVGDDLHARIFLSFRPPDVEMPRACIVCGQRAFDAVTARGFVPVRIVDDKGRLERRYFRGPLTWTPERLLVGLRSLDIVDELEALERLRGSYDGKAHARSLRSPAIDERLRELARSENAWVREAANAALEDR